MSDNSKPREGYDQKAYEENYDRIFRKKEVKTHTGKLAPFGH
jgi:hypothetical protein